MTTQDSAAIVPGEASEAFLGDGPRISDTYSAADDVNPICGCHRRAQCLGCGTCTTCDGCYCGED